MLLVFKKIMLEKIILLSFVIFCKKRASCYACQWYRMCTIRITDVLPEMQMSSAWEFSAVCHAVVCVFETSSSRSGRWTRPQVCWCVLASVFSPLPQAFRRLSPSNCVWMCVLAAVFVYDSHLASFPWQLVQVEVLILETLLSFVQSSTVVAKYPSDEK